MKSVLPKPCSWWTDQVMIFIWRRGVHPISDHSFLQTDTRDHQLQLQTQRPKSCCKPAGRGGHSAPQQGPVLDRPWSLEGLTEPWWPGEGVSWRRRGRSGVQRGADLRVGGGGYGQHQTVIKAFDNKRINREDSKWQMIGGGSRGWGWGRQRKTMFPQDRDSPHPLTPALTTPLWPTALVRTYVIYRGDSSALSRALLHWRLMLPCERRKQLILSFLLQMLI